MRVSFDVDFSRLIGFEQMNPEADEGVDFRDDALGASRGAKRGAEGEVCASAQTGETERPAGR